MIEPKPERDCDSIERRLYCRGWNDALAAAQPASQPSAEAPRCAKCGVGLPIFSSISVCDACALAASGAEPVECPHCGGEGAHASERECYGQGPAPYDHASPVARQPLTEEEIDDFMHDDPVEFARRIERAHGIAATPAPRGDSLKQGE